jgi:outer membrane protein assembly factor BamD (BamD/ComL family)
MGAFSSYRQGNYVEAINAGKRYVQLYPRRLTRPMRNTSLA